MNNNDEKIFGFPSEYLDGALGYPDYDLERTFTIPDITGDRIFNKANTDLSKGILSLAGIKSSNIFSSFGKGQENSGSIVSKLDLGLEKNLLDDISSISGILNKSSSVLSKDFQNSSGIKNNNTFNKSDIFNSNPLGLNNISRELPKPLILEEDKNNFRKEKPPLIEGIHEMNRTEDENEHKPVITELYAFLTESMKKRTLVRIFVVLLKKSNINFYPTQIPLFYILSKRSLI